METAFTGAYLFNRFCIAVDSKIRVWLSEGVEHSLGWRHTSVLISGLAERPTGGRHCHDNCQQLQSDRGPQIISHHDTQPITAVFFYHGKFQQQPVSHFYVAEGSNFFMLFLIFFCFIFFMLAFIFRFSTKAFYLALTHYYRVIQ